MIKDDPKVGGPMPLSLKEKAMIKLSFAQLTENGSNIAECFYKNLFEMAPLIKPLFKGDHTVLNIHFNELIGSAVDKVDNFDELSSDLLDLGKRHKTYQAKEMHFAIVKAALLLSIQYELKGQCTEATIDAWKKYIDDISAIMIKGMSMVSENE